MIHFFPAIWVFPERSTGPGLLAWVASGCSFLPGIMCGLSGPVVYMPTKGPIGHVDVGHRWDRVAMDLLDMSVTTPKGNRYVLVMVDCFSRWTEACPLPDKTALAVADAFFQHIVCRFGMPSVIHSDQGREFENKVMQELYFGSLVLQRIRWCGALLQCWCFTSLRCTVADIMDTLANSSPIRTYMDNYHSMRVSHDAHRSDPKDLCSLGVVDLDVSLSPDAFGLRAFDISKPLTRMLPGSSPCELRLMLPDSDIVPEGFHGVSLRTWPRLLPGDHCISPPGMLLRSADDGRRAI